MTKSSCRLCTSGGHSKSWLVLWEHASSARTPAWILAQATVTLSRCERIKVLVNYPCNKGRIALRSRFPVAEIIKSMRMGMILTVLKFIQDPPGIRPWIARGTTWAPQSWAVPDEGNRMCPAQEATVLEWTSKTCAIFHAELSTSLYTRTTFDITTTGTERSHAFDTLVAMEDGCTKHPRFLDDHQVLHLCLCRVDDLSTSRRWCSRE